MCNKVDAGLLSNKRNRKNYWIREGGAGHLGIGAIDRVHPLAYGDGEGGLFHTVNAVDRLRIGKGEGLVVSAHAPGFGEEKTDLELS